jgi:hypothetical protein
VRHAQGVTGGLALPGGFAEWEGAGLPVTRGEENLAGLVLESLDRAAQRARRA